MFLKKSQNSELLTFYVFSNLFHYTMKFTDNDAFQKNPVQLFFPPHAASDWLVSFQIQRLFPRTIKKLNTHT